MEMKFLVKSVGLWLLLLVAEANAVYTTAEDKQKEIETSSCLKGPVTAPGQ